MSFPNDVLFKKTFFLLFASVILSGCSFNDFQEKVLLPKIDYEEAEKSIQTYLDEKYEKEFTITKSERGCTGLGADCANHVYAYVYPNKTPEITFQVTYDTKTKELYDNYSTSYWENQVEGEFKEPFEKTFEGVKSFVAVYSKYSDLDSEPFPYYRDLLDEEMMTVRFVVTIDKKKESEENWRKEAKKLIAFKQMLINEGIRENQIGSFEVAVWGKEHDNRDADLVFLYKINLEYVSTEETTMDVIKEYHKY